MKIFARIQIGIWFFSTNDAFLQPTAYDDLVKTSALCTLSGCLDILESKWLILQAMYRRREKAGISEHQHDQEISAQDSCIQRSIRQHSNLLR